MRVKEKVQQEQMVYVMPIDSLLKTFLMLEIKSFPTLSCYQKWI